MLNVDNLENVNSLAQKNTCSILINYTVTF